MLDKTLTTLAAALTHRQHALTSNDRRHAERSPMFLCTDNQRFV